MLRSLFGLAGGGGGGTPLDSFTSASSQADSAAKAADSFFSGMRNGSLIVKGRAEDNADGIEAVAFGQKLSVNSDALIVGALVIVAVLYFRGR